MREWQNLSHVRWYCRYHVVIVPKYQKRAILGNLWRQIGGILRELCVQHEERRQEQLPFGGLQPPARAS